MAVETFEDMTTAFSDMFDIEGRFIEEFEEILEMDINGRYGRSMDMKKLSLEEPTSVETLEEPMP